jgi:hypothetical protein
LREHLQSAQRRRVAAFDAELREDVAKVLFHRQRWMRLPLKLVTNNSALAVVARD